MNRLRGLLAAPAAAGMLAAMAACAAAGGVEVAAGFEGFVRLGAWTPVAVRLVPSEGGTPRNGADLATKVFVWAEDPDGQFVRSPPARWRVNDGGERVAATTVRPGRPGGRLRIDVERPGSNAAEVHEVRLPATAFSSQRVILAIGDVPGLERVCRLLGDDQGTRPRPVQVKRPGELGRSPLDFDAADVIVVCGAVIADGGAVPDEVLRAIDGWVRRGGQMLLFAGPSAKSIAAAPSIVNSWLPGSFDRLVPLRRTASLEAFARSSRPLEVASASPLLVPKFSDLGAESDAVIEVFEGRDPADLPLVVRRAHGFGTIVWAAVEPDLPPLRSWSGTDGLLTEVLESFLGGGARPGDVSFASRSGTADLADQLRRAIDTFPGVAPVSFEWIALLAGLYVVSLYPAGWWAVEWMKRRTGRDPVAFAWLLLPASVVAFTLVASRVSQRSHSRSWRQSRCDVVDLDAAGGNVRASSFSGTWSPANAAVDRSVRPRAGVVDVGFVAAADGTAADNAAADITAADITAADITAADRSAEVSWFAAAGTGLGAIEAPSPHPSLAAADYHFGDSLDLLEGVPIAASSSRLFEAEWRAEVSSLGAGVVGRLDRDAQGTLRGSLESRLPFPLEQCVLAHAGWLYDVGLFEAGRPFDPSGGRGPRSLAGSLTRRGSDREHDQAIRYDPVSRDIARILEVAGLHGAAGGPGYTSLESGRLERLDFSRLLAANRAILVGTGPVATDWIGGDGDSKAPASEGDGGGVSVWRIVIPIGRWIGGDAGRNR